MFDKTYLHIARVKFLNMYDSFFRRRIFSIYWYIFHFNFFIACKKFGWNSQIEVSKEIRMKIFGWSYLQTIMLSWGGLTRKILSHLFSREKYLLLSLDNEKSLIFKCYILTMYYKKSNYI